MRNGTGNPVTKLRHSLLLHQADCRSPRERVAAHEYTAVSIVL
jgi:hypothetical protein